MACEGEKAAVETKKSEYNAAVGVAAAKCEADPFVEADYQAAIGALDVKHAELKAAIGAYKACLAGGPGGGGNPPN